MPTEETRSSRFGRRTERRTEGRADRSPDPAAELRQLQRWLDDGGAEPAAPGAHTPVMWSPVALSARLEAEHALHSLPRRTGHISADARKTIRRIVTRVDHRQLSLGAATAQLRDLTVRLTQHRLAEESRRRPREWQLLRTNAHTDRIPALHRVLLATVDGTTYGRG